MFIALIIFFFLLENYQYTGSLQSFKINVTYAHKFKYLSLIYQCCLCYLFHELFSFEPRNTRYTFQYNLIPFSHAIHYKISFESSSNGPMKCYKIKYKKYYVLYLFSNGSRMRVYDFSGQVSTYVQAELNHGIPGNSATKKVTTKKLKTRTLQIRLIIDIDVFTL